MVNPNYREINAKEQLGRANSVFRYYQKLIALRRNSPDSELIVYGSYQLIDPAGPSPAVCLPAHPGGQDPAHRVQPVRPADDLCPAGGAGGPEEPPAHRQLG